MVKPVWILMNKEIIGGSGVSWTICKSFARCTFKRQLIKSHISMYVCTCMYVCSTQITMPAPHHSSFYRLDALPDAQPTVSKHWRQILQDHNNKYYYQATKGCFYCCSRYLSCVQSHYNDTFTCLCLPLHLKWSLLLQKLRKLDYTEQINIQWNTIKNNAKVLVQQ